MRGFNAERLYGQVTSNQIDAHAAVRTLKDEYQALERTLARETAVAEALRAIETVMVDSRDALVRTADGQWGLIDQGGHVYLRVRSLQELGQACAAQADRIRREAATRLMTQAKHDADRRGGYRSRCD
jgi:hypothetical protein